MCVNVWVKIDQWKIKPVGGSKNHLPLKVTCKGKAKSELAKSSWALAKIKHKSWWYIHMILIWSILENVKVLDFDL